VPHGVLHVPVAEDADKARNRHLGIVLARLHILGQHCLRTLLGTLLPPDPLPDDHARLERARRPWVSRLRHSVARRVHHILDVARGSTRAPLRKRRRAVAAARLTTKYVFIRSLEPLAPPLRNPDAAELRTK
jgi:hypothetical protein